MSLVNNANDGQMTLFHPSAEIKSKFRFRLWKCPQSGQRQQKRKEPNKVRNLIVVVEGGCGNVSLHTPFFGHEVLEVE